MTLIVGRVDKGNVILIGDTKLTYMYDEKNPYIDGCLKLYRVNDELAFGFSGNVEHVKNVMPELMKCTSAKQITDIACNYRDKFNLDFDLIVAQYGDEFLYVLKDGKISRNTVAYIGDHYAFDRFQEILNNNIKSLDSNLKTMNISMQRLPKPAWKDNIYSRMLSSFIELLKSGNNSSVGGITVSLCTDEFKFRYMNYANTISNPLNFENIKNGQTIVDFGSAQNGSFSVEFNDASWYGGDFSDIGFYFINGGFGIIFPLNGDFLRYAKTVKADNPAFWILNSSKEYGYGVGLSFLTPDHCGIAGEQLLKEKKWSDAVYCYELCIKSEEHLKKSGVFDRYIDGYAVGLFNSGRREESVALLRNIMSTNSPLPMCNKRYLQLLELLG